MAQKERTLYVQRKDGRSVETVDEFPAGTREERRYARAMLSEYAMADPSARHYLSSRACKGWNEDTQVSQ